ncbi:precorrin-2 dehydrogenase/sirohydrochlorin ferrochelatase family protein [Deinococcus radiotolerans]|uniref:precorrin-2 dehydrogenase/sirohydrochlorin ferrochelatase family protein n=1 Tax=Deinococcus radiotolerans TaxID=1309407 RepID=UPI001E535619|nr:bifunctional precorrin-2 dehydrogenase/sirohydrochlorin ferrochelatase [Deinococcus radiotolerans]
MSFLPAFLDLRGVRAVVIGGGTVALRRARTLLDAGAQVQVIAPQQHPDFAALPVTALSRHYRRGDLSGAALVIAATGSADVNAAVVRDAQAQGSLVNDAADATRGNWRFPAQAERAGVQVAVTSGRELPLLAQALAERITALLPDEESLDGWTARRELAITQPDTQRAASLDALRADIRRAVGLA